MIHTDTDYAIFTNGKCWAIATKGAGPAGERWNAEVLERYAGHEIREMPRSEACAAHLAYLETLPGFQKQLL